MCCNPKSYAGAWRSAIAAIAVFATVIVTERSAVAAMFITEFMASNGSTLADGDGDFSDWIEVFNSGPGSQNLSGWHLTDDAAAKSKWTFPSITVPANGYLVVFASDKNRAVAGSELHANFKLSGSGEYLALVQPGGSVVAYEYAPAFPPQSTDVSYGLTVDRSAERCFLDPTPGAINDETPACASVARLQFSKSRGFYETRFNLAISTSTPGTTIRYTLDGSEPTTSHGTEYAGPISINTTRVVRALGYKPGVQPVPPSETHTYIFLDDVLEQPANVPGYPNSVYSVGADQSAPHDHEMDPGIVNAPAYASSIKPGFLSIPTLSIAVDKGDMFGDDGFYDGDGEAAASVEVIYPAEPDESEQANCAIEGHSTVRLKRSLQLEFKGAYGPSSFRTELLETGPGSGDSAKKTVERLVLRGGNNRSWARAWNPDRTTYTEDEFYRSSQIRMSGIGAHGTFVHLYINGLYWGLYNAVEQPEEHFAAIYLGGDSDGWFSTNHSGVESGDDTRWEYLRGTLVNKDLTNGANYAELQQYLDVAQFSDYLIVGWYVGLTDWPANNWYAGNRNDVPGPVLHFAWDGEWSWDVSLTHTVDGAWVHPAFRAASQNSLDMAKLWRAIRKNSEFMVSFADRVHAHTSGSGALTDAAAHARWATLNAYIYDAVIAESARWGDALQTLGQPTRTRNGDWQSEVDAIDDQITGNAAQLIAALRTEGYYPGIDAPSVSIPNSQATITKTGGGTIYYTTNGSDPRAVGGAIAAAASAYAGSFPVAPGTLVRARVKNGAVWSAVDEETAAAAPACQSASDCGDGNPCTTDACSGSGTCTHSFNTVSCNDGLFCTTNDKCGGGLCSGSGDPCGGATPFCDESANACEECQSDAHCDDGGFCNGEEFCDSGFCEMSTNLPCGTDITCFEASDTCGECGLDGQCDDRLFCNGTEACEEGFCASGTAPCPDSVHCDEGMDACTGCVDDGECADQDACTTGHACDAGTCSTPVAVVCDDGVFCNGVETCFAALGCVAGSPPLDCSSLDSACTVGSCDEATQACGADPANEGGGCDDGSACTVGDVCTLGVCAGTSPCVDECEACDGNGGCLSRCGHPVSDPAGGLRASDALYLLQVGVGAQICAPCVCDLNGSGLVTASDALAALRASVGVETPLDCPPLAAFRYSTTTTLED